MTTQTIKKTFSLPHYIANRLDEISNHTSYSQSNLVLQALSSYMHRYENDDSLESWLERNGRCSGGSGVIE